MAKMDIKHAFRLCPVRPEDWCLLGMFWNNCYFVDTRLPFGSRSSPFIFNTFADALTWILTTIFLIPHVIHYLDDFFFAHTGELASQMETAKKAFNWLGVPLASEKIEGPTTKITYLGIEIDSVTFTIRLPPDKLSNLVADLQYWYRRNSCTKLELLSIIGKLSFAAKVVKPGRLFLRRLINLSTTVDKLHHHIHLNKEAKLDIKWWFDFLQPWNGVSIIQSQISNAQELQLFTDASNSGFGAVYGNQWFSSPWPEKFKSYHINIKELFAIIAAVFTWGLQWKDRQILLYSDNMTVCDMWLSTSSKDTTAMFYMRHLFLFAANHNFNLLIKHIPGRHNTLADLLSRLQVQQFLQLHVNAKPFPAVINHAIWKLSTEL